MAFGSVLAGSGVLLVALLFRDPRAPRWTAIAVVAVVLAVPATGFIGFGLSHLLTGGYRLLHGVGNPLELAALLGVAAALVLLILPIRRRLWADAAIIGGLAQVSPLPAASPPTVRRAHPRRGGRHPGRRHEPPDLSPGRGGAAARRP